MMRTLRRAVAIAGCMVATLATTSVAANAAPPKPSTTSGPTCGGVTQMARSSGGYWTCTFDDEFGGKTLDSSKWTVQTTEGSGFVTGPACFVNSPNNVSVARGYLNLTVRQEAAPFTCKDPLGDFTTQYTSGEAMTFGTFSQAYGRFDVKAKLPATAVKGLQESLWLWPEDPNKFAGGWPASGEIDIAEKFSTYPDRAIPFIHYNAAQPDPNVTNNYCKLNPLVQFHSFAAEWTPTAITILYDNKVCLVDNWDPAAPLVKPEPFNQPFIVALTQALGIGDNAFVAGSTPLPATTQIDYVRVWK